MDIFGKKTIEQLTVELRQKDEALKALSEKKAQLEISLMRYEEHEKLRKRIEYLMNEKIPEEQNARKDYFSNITMFYKTIMKDKIAHMISMQKDDLIIFGRNQREDDFYRANISILYLLDEWFEHAERTHLSNLQETRQAVESSLDIADTIKSKYQPPKI